MEIPSKGHLEGSKACPNGDRLLSLRRERACLKCSVVAPEETSSFHLHVVWCSKTHGRPRNPPKTRMVQMIEKYRKLSLRLDNGAVIGHSEKLLGDPNGGPVLLPVDKAFSRGLVTERQVKRLEALLIQMHSRAPNAAPLRSLSELNRKRKEPDSAQVALLAVVYFCASGSWMKPSCNTGIAQAAAVIFPFSDPEHVDDLRLGLPSFEACFIERDSLPFCIPCGAQSVHFCAYSTK